MRTVLRQTLASILPGLSAWAGLACGQDPEPPPAVVHAPGPEVTIEAVAPPALPPSTPLFGGGSGLLTSPLGTPAQGFLGGFAAGSAGQDPEPPGPPPPPRSASRLVVEPLILDLGEIRQQEYPLEFAFQVEGGAPIVVHELLSSCGCTEARLEIDGQPYVFGSPLPGGTRGRLLGVFDARKYRNEKNTSLRLVGDQANGPVEVRVLSQIKPTFLVRPPALRFGEVAQATVRAGGAAHMVRVQTEEPFEVLRWRELPEWCTVEAAGPAQHDPAKGRYLCEFQVRLAPNAPAGMLFGAAIAETSLQQDLELTIQAAVLGPVQYQPAGRLQFGPVPAGQSRIMVLRVQGAAGVQVPLPQAEIRGGEGAAAAFTASVQELVPGSSYLVEVVLSAEAAAGLQQATLHLRYPEASGLSAHEARVLAAVQGAR